MDKLLAMAATFPVVSTLAALTYAGIVLVLVVRPARAWLAGAIAFPTPTQGRSLAAVDALRGLAALWVALLHFWQWPADSFGLPTTTYEVIKSGARAVPIFVVVSGFLIWGAARQIRNAADLRRYGLNRILRLFPAFLAVVLASLAVGFALGHGTIPGQWPWKVLLHEAIMARSFDSRLLILPQAWSLFVELNFYLLAPFAAVLLTRRRVAALALLVLVFYLAEFRGDAREFGLWKYFFVGMAARELADGAWAEKPEIVHLLVFLGGAALLALDLRVDWIAAGLSLLGIEGSPSDARMSLGLGLAAGALVLAAATSELVERVLGWRPLQMIGVVSYSIFLWHSVLIAVDLPILYTAEGSVAALRPSPLAVDFGWPLLVVAVPALIGVGVASFLAIERPFLRLRPPRPAA